MLAKYQALSERKSWIRFSADQALSAGDALFTGTTADPVVRRWLGSTMMSLFLTPKSENERYAWQIRKSADMAVFVSKQNDKAHWVDARSYTANLAGSKRSYSFLTTA